MFFDHPVPFLNSFKKNLLTKFYDVWAIYVSSRALTWFYYSHKGKNAPLPGGHIFQPTETIFELVQNIIWKKLRTKFHDDRTINASSRVKNAHPWDIIGKNLLNKFHEYRTINDNYMGNSKVHNYFL
ncbi:hypothetical protein DPMN_096553 [Dreissena polymorpha]|uniref:Uncharacterized protein n=1 Tax=Dreissena polymorpha TaxID=45954 RepID=A0A9D4LA27_DREPO|nr:hypothetical protein DPMN_096553 [Dreissena polymorpha]